MARLFDRNMFIMLLAIMVGIIIITYFIADLQGRTQIESLQSEHVIQIEYINRLNENFTDHFLQGSIIMDSAREVREVGNYHFDFALFWYNTALANLLESYISYCIENCSNAMVNYLASYENFNDSKPYFELASNFTDRQLYITVLEYYVEFAEVGKEITLLRYNASRYLMQAAENLSVGDLENVSMLMDWFNETLLLYGELLEEYDGLKGQIDGYLFFEEDRTKPPKG